MATPLLVTVYYLHCNESVGEWVTVTHLAAEPKRTFFVSTFSKYIYTTNEHVREWVSTSP